MSKPEQKSGPSNYDLFVESANLDQGNYPISAVQDWNGYKYIRDGNNLQHQIVVDDYGNLIEPWEGTVPAYIQNGKLIAGPRPGFPSETITDNREAYKVYKNAVGDYYNTEYSPERVALVATGGAYNRFFPTQNARLLYDMATGGDWRSSMMYGNNGIVSDEFAAEHPYLAAGINFAGDFATFNAGNISKMLNPTRLITNGRASYTGPTPVPAPGETYYLPRGEKVTHTWEATFNGSGGAASRKFGTGKGQNNLVNKGSKSVKTSTKHGNQGWNDGSYTKVYSVEVGNPEAPVTDKYTWNPAIPQWSTTGAVMPTYAPQDVTIVGVPYHNEVVRNFHDDGWIEKFQATPEGGVFWHNGKSYIKQTGGRDRFVRESYNDGQTPWGNSATQVYFDRGVPVVEVPWGTQTGITRKAGEDTGNINYNKAVNRNTGKSEKSKAKGK